LDGRGINPNQVAAVSVFTSPLPLKETLRGENGFSSPLKLEDGR
jgi:hypothetical protein